MHVCVKFDEHWLHHLDCTASAGIHAIFADFAISLTFNGFCGAFWFKSWQFRLQDRLSKLSSHFSDCLVHICVKFDEHWLHY